MSDVRASTGLLSVVMQMGEQGLGVLDPLRDALDRLTPAMFDGVEQRLFEAARTKVAVGETPTSFALSRAAGVAPLEAARVRRAGQGLFGDLRSATEAVMRDYGQSAMIEGLTAALSAARRGELAEAQVLAQDAAETTRLGDPTGSLDDFMDHDLEAEREPRLIRFTLQQLNEDIGGGLSTAPSLCMSMIAAPSGVGKSSFVHQQIPYWLITQGHWVMLASGELDADYNFNQITRMQARMGESRLNFRTPADQKMLRRAREELLQKVGAGHLTVAHEEFTPERIAELARLKAREHREARDAGAISPNSRLIVVVHNWDNMFASYDYGARREDQVFSSWMHRFALQAGEYGYHHMNLTQTSGEAEDLKGPAEAHQMQGSRKLNSKTAHQLNLYRCRNTTALETALKEGGEMPAWGRPQIAVRKARGGGRSGTRFYDTNAQVGTWHDLPGTAEY